MNLYPCRNSCTFGIAFITCLLLAGIPAAMAADGTNATSPAGGTIIVTIPRGASVYLNDEFRGIVPVKIENIPPGNYLVNVSKDGYNNDTAPVVLFEGSTREIGFTLEPASAAPAVSTGSGSVAVDSSPGGASVFIDGKNVGTTRLDGYALVIDTVPSGSHTVSVELAGYPVYTSTVTVTKNQVVKVSADLQARSPAPAGTPVATTDRTQPAPLAPLTAAAAAGLIGFAAAFRRS